MKHKKSYRIWFLAFLAFAVFLAVLTRLDVWTFITGLSSTELIVMALLFLIAAGSGITLVLQYFDQSVLQILQTIQQVEEGNLSVRCSYRARNSLGSIAAAVNCLIEAMEKRSNESAELHSELASIIKNIPGGMFRCKADKNFTFLFVNKGFLSLLGYTEEELKTIFCNEFINVVYKDDRDMLRKTAEAQSLTSETIDAVYRVYHAGGGFRWVHQQGSFMIDDNGTWHDNVIIDVTEEIQAQDAHIASESRYRLVMRATSDWICEFDLTNNRLLMDNKPFDNVIPRVARGSYEQALNYLVERLLYPEDAVSVSQKFSRQNLLKEFGSGKNEITGEYRYKTDDGSYVWSSVTMIPILEVGSGAMHCVAYFRNVNDRKTAELALLEKAQSDSLTHLYNNETTQTMISSFLSREGKDGKHAMLVLDIDNFKHVNDKCGHLFGDAVLTNVSKKMKQIFRTSDILGRVGGDEFVIFLKNIASVDSIVEKSETFLRQFHEAFTNNDRGYHISGSIGIALYPEHGDTYTELMERADQALYQAKDAGKNGCAIYNMTEMPQRKTCAVAENAEVLAAEKDGFKIDNIECMFMASVFRSLFESIHTQDSIREVLQTIGEHYHASQVYIIANPSENSQNVINYEWKNTKTPVTREQIYQFARMKSASLCQPLFQREGVFYCNDISKLPESLAAALTKQNVNFIIQFAVIESGVIQGIAGIASCKDDICLTQSEIDTLDILSRVLQLFIQKHVQLG